MEGETYSLGSSGVVCPIRSGNSAPEHSDRDNPRRHVPSSGDKTSPTTAKQAFRDSRLAPISTFEAWITEEKIIRLLVRPRFRLAAKRRELRQWSRLFPDLRGQPEARLPDIYPPRREWWHCRPKHREGMDESEVWARALEIRMLQGLHGNETWARNLQREISDIRHSATGKRLHKFEAPRVYQMRDLCDPKKCRVISKFGHRDCVILGLVNGYTSKWIDPFLADSSIAFRKNPKRTVQTALGELQDLNLARGSCALYVAECDIRSFFDVLHHGVIEESIAILAARMMAAGVVLDPRIREMVSAYLSCYSFAHSVLPYVPVAGEKRPLESLQEFYPAPLAEPLGIPQGGALSNLLANIVLDRADRAVARCQGADDRALAYWRYCDDSLIVSSHSDVCAKAFGAYLECLHSLRLPIHAPVDPLPYLGGNKAAHWNAKSRATYPWGGDIEEGQIPWISAWGVQFRYDGKARLRPASIRRLHLKMRALSQRLKACSQQRPEIGEGERVTRYFGSKVMAVAYGRRWQCSRKPAKRCWYAWAAILKQWPHDCAFLRKLDRHFGSLVAGLRNSLCAMTNARRKEDPRRWSYFFNFFKGRSCCRSVPPRGNS